MKLITRTTLPKFMFRMRVEYVMFQLLDIQQFDAANWANSTQTCFELWVFNHPFTCHRHFVLVRLPMLSCFACTCKSFFTFRAEESPRLVNLDFVLLKRERGLKNFFAFSSTTPRKLENSLNLFFIPWSKTEEKKVLLGKNSIYQMFIYDRLAIDEWGRECCGKIRKLSHDIFAFILLNI